MKIEIETKHVIELLPVIVALSMCIYWAATGDKVRSDPYLLGFFRGFIWPKHHYQGSQMAANGRCYEQWPT